MNAFKELSLQLKDFYTSGARDAIDHEGQQAIDKADSLVKKMWEIFNGYQHRTILLALAFALSSRIDAIPEEEYESKEN